MIWCWRLVVIYLFYQPSLLHCPWQYTTNHENPICTLGYLPRKREKGIPWIPFLVGGGFNVFLFWSFQFAQVSQTTTLWLTNPRDVLRSDSPPSSVGTHLNLESIEASGRLRVMLSLVGNLTQCGKSCSPTCRTDWHNFFVNPPQDILVSSLKCWFGRSKRLVWAFFRVGLVTVFKQMRAFLMGHQLNSTILWCWIYFSSYTRSFPLILKC